jgi:hypothetical protein
MGRLHLRAEGAVYPNVQESGESFALDAAGLAGGGGGRLPAPGVNYGVVSGMFGRPGGPRLLAVWDAGRVVVFRTPSTGEGRRYVLSG